MLVYIAVFGFLICLFDGSPGFTLKTGLSSIFGISNIFLYISSSNYFTDALDLNPDALKTTLNLSVDNAVSVDSVVSPFIVLEYLIKI